MIEWHLQPNEHEQTLGDSEGQGSLVCCSPLGHKELVTTERPNNNKLAMLLFSHSSRVQFLETPWTAARRASLSFTTFQSLLKRRSIESMMPSNHLVLCCLRLLLPQSFPASGAFPMSRLFASGGQSTGISASASVLPMNIQD